MSDPIEVRPLPATEVSTTAPSVVEVRPTGEPATVTVSTSGETPAVAVVAPEGVPEVTVAPPSPPAAISVAVAMGPRGPRGLPGSAVASHHHEQMTPAAEWYIVHDLGMKPNVTVQDSAGTTVVGGIIYHDNYSLTLTFSAAFAGHAYLS